MNSSINDKNVNNYNANVGTPLFSQPQNVQEQSYEPNVNVAPQADIPPELGQIENLPQGIQNIAPEATDIGNNQQLNIETRLL